jgi:hypothetical protein
MAPGQGSPVIDVFPVDGCLSGSTGSDQRGLPPQGPACDIGAVEVQQLQISDAQVAEGDTGQTTMTLSVALSGAAPSPVSVGFETADGTALAGEDYVATSVTVLIGAGEQSGTITVEVIGDSVREATEAFTVSLAHPEGAVVARGTAVATILDDD